jgi:hypothetical protein
MRNLKIVKLLHTLIWIIMTVAILHVVYVGLTGELSSLLVISLPLVSLECVVLLTNRGECPLRNVAAGLTQERHDGFDIYIPGWLARYNVPICGGLFTIGLILVIVRILSAR